ncbi:MAG TPA: PQQ-dependent sugar dehydrogenase [Solirubrobacterales bacterium]|nr:PQQ-dependent sugar dehydrogenase [Solirubrobacterales bacterium]
MIELIRAAGKIWVVAVLLTGLWCASAQALSLQPVGNFEEPIYVTSAPNNPDRLFVVERQGRIIQVENGTRTVFADIRSQIEIEPESEGGLLSIALSPDFQTSGRLFVYYTGKEEEPSEIHVAEMVASGGFAPLASLRNLLTISHPNQRNHYGGQLQFGPEGNLFIGTGDGGGSNDIEHNAQKLSSELGKILRIDPDTDGVIVFSIPPGNPFGPSTVFSYGLRNPFRFSFDRLTGALTIGDVGQGAREEVDYAPAPGLGAGANYGWNCREGLIAGPATDEGCGSGSYVNPIFDYPHGEPPGDVAHGCAIIGGYVARGPGYGDLYGRYVYGDLCAGEIRSLLPALPFAGGDRSEGVEVTSLNSFGEDSCGRLYAVSGAGPVYRLVGSGGESCAPQAKQPDLKSSFVGIRALRRKVKRNKRAFITAFVSPCDGRRGQPVSLWQGQRRIGTRHLDRVCSVRFRPRIKHRVRYRATVRSDGTYVEATSRKLNIRILRRHR